jgi:hypothetical protein
MTVIDESGCMNGDVAYFNCLTGLSKITKKTAVRVSNVVLIVVLLKQYTE